MAGHGYPHCEGTVSSFLSAPVLCGTLTPLYPSTVSLWFDRGLLRLSLSMTMQSLVKHFLTEGDKFVITQISPLADQGGYAVASNYGKPTAAFS
jgi:hypothetical protein